MEFEIITWRLEMASPAQLKPSSEKPGLEIRRVQPSAELSRYLYLSVGRSCVWWERINWDLQTWVRHVNKESVEVNLATINNVPCGFFEVIDHGDDVKEISLFGLLPDFVSQGIGGHFLTRATRSLWDDGAKRIWLETSILDNERALPNYLARGFEPLSERREVKAIPDQLDARVEEHVSNVELADVLKLVDLTPTG